MSIHLYSRINTELITLIELLTPLQMISRYLYLQYFANLIFRKRVTTSIQLNGCSVRRWKHASRYIVLNNFPGAISKVEKFCIFCNVTKAFMVLFFHFRSIISRFFFWWYFYTLMNNANFLVAWSIQCIDSKYIFSDEKHNINLTVQIFYVKYKVEI